MPVALYTGIQNLLTSPLKSPVESLMFAIGNYLLSNTDVTLHNSQTLIKVTVLGLDHIQALR